MKRLLLFLLLILTILILVVKSRPYSAVDILIGQEIQQFNPTWFDLLMRFVSNLAAATGMGGVLLLAVCLLLYLMRKRKQALMLFLSTAGINLVATIFKAYVARPRPSPNLVEQVGHYPGLDSFPSGHVLWAIGFYGFLALVVWMEVRHRWWRRVLISLLSSVILLMGLSRIYLGAHWFSDVVGSYLIGSVWLLLMIHLYRLYRRVT